MPMFDQNLIIGLVVLAVVVLGVYSYAPQLIRRFMPGSGLAENFADAKKGKGGKSGKTADGFINPPAAQPVNVTGSAMSGSGAAASGAPHSIIPSLKPKTNSSGAPENFADYQESLSDTMGSVPMKPIKKPQDCFPREQLNAIELLPQDTNSQWAQVNPTGAGDMIGKNMLSAGALIGVNTIGQSLRNANYQLRAEPPNPQVQVSPWQQSTIEPDLQRRALE